MDVPLHGPKDLTKKGGDLFFDRRKMIASKAKKFFTKPSTYLLDVPAAWSTLTYTIKGED
jgi:hypothetical protein